MVLDRKDPTKVTSLTVFVEGDDNPVKTLDRGPPAGQHRDDAERPAADRGSRLEPAVPGRSTASRTPRRRGSGTCRSRGDARGRGRRVDQSADGGPTDVDGRPRRQLGRLGVDGHRRRLGGLRPGAFLINVQAHTLWVEKAPGDDNNGDGQPDFTYKREGGQLALLHIPGA